MVSSGRSRLPPPMAAWRIAAWRRARLSRVGLRRLAKSGSSAGDAGFASAATARASRSMVSTGIERLELGRLAVGAERDLLDPCLRVLEPRLAVAPQPV